MMTTNPGMCDAGGRREGDSTNPYQAPSRRADDSLHQPYGPYLSLSPLLSGLTVWLWLCAVGEAVGVLVEWTRALPAWFYLPLRLGPFFICALLFSRYLYRSNVNCRALGVGPVSYTPASMVWWHFVPLAHLIVPYLAVREAFSASVVDSDTDEVPASALWWWLCWAGSSVSVYAALALRPGSGAGLWLSLSASLAYIASCVLAVDVARTLAALQDSTARSLEAGR
jgi:hypothetical protein